MHHLSRRDLLGSALTLGATAGACFGQDDLLAPVASGSSATKPDAWRGLKGGVASYSLRGMKLDPAIAAIQRVGLRYVSVKDIHLPMKSSAEERKSVAQNFKDAGITPLSCGVVTMEND